VTVVALLLAVLVAVVVLAILRARRLSPHAQAMHEVLEERLRLARAEIEAVAGDNGPNPVGDAMREMLRQRLWLRDYGDAATPVQLAEVRDAILLARKRIDQELIRIEEARLPRD
jgi:Flp pilus assembly protein TadB